MIAVAHLFAAAKHSLLPESKQMRHCKDFDQLYSPFSIPTVFKR
jgi:hypothetical protein